MNHISDQFSRLMVLCALMLVSQWAAAEQKVEFGTVAVHYNAFDSTFLQPKVAQSYGITRSRYRGVVSVSVQNTEGEGFPTSMEAVISGKAINLSSQEKDLNFKKVKEGDVIYYLSTFPFTDKEHLRFDLSVLPHGHKKARSVSFKRQFFVD